MATTEDVQELTASERMLVAADEFWFKIESAMNLLAAFFIFGIMLLGVAQVIGRSIFNQHVRGYVDIVEVSITVFAFLAISYCQRLAGHVRMEIIIGRFKGRALWLTEIFGTIVITFIVFVLTEAIVGAHLHRKCTICSAIFRLITYRKYLKDNSYFKADIILREIANT